MAAVQTNNLSAFYTAMIGVIGFILTALQSYTSYIDGEKASLDSKLKDRDVEIARLFNDYDVINTSDELIDKVTSLFNKIIEPLRKSNCEIPSSLYQGDLIELQKCIQAVREIISTMSSIEDSIIEAKLSVSEGEKVKVISKLALSIINMKNEVKKMKSLLKELQSLIHKKLEDIHNLEHLLSQLEQWLCAIWNEQHSDSYVHSFDFNLTKTYVEKMVECPAKKSLRILINKTDSDTKQKLDLIKNDIKAIISLNGIIGKSYDFEDDFKNFDWIIGLRNSWISLSENKGIKKLIGEWNKMNPNSQDDFKDTFRYLSYIET
jgi:hypothetical protein